MASSLTFEDGTKLCGESLGISGEISGQLIVNRAMTGYQEILTDPSYEGQILVFTTPHIGTVGVNWEDMESSKIWASGVVMRSYSSYVSNWRAQNSLQDFLLKQNKIAVTGVDTRFIAQFIRENGNQNGHLTAKHQDPAYAYVKQEFVNSFLEGEMHIAVIDYGVKRSIIQRLQEIGARTTLVSPKNTYEDIMQLDVDGVVLSNGPGDPTEYDIKAIQKLIEANVPLFGICLGHQLLAIASGAKTKKMQVGRHGVHYPVKDLETNRIWISSQNHCFVVEEKNLPSCLKVTHRCLFDGTIAGLCRVDKPVLSFQGHPEGSAGPHDCFQLFKKFAEICQSVLI